MIQGSDEWRLARLGKVGASQMADVIAKTKNGYGALRANLMAAKLAERLTGTIADSYVSQPMQWGTDTEAEARNAYAFYSGVDVVETGFVPHPIIRATGASPDGLIGDDGLVEIKAPNTATHIETLLGGKVPGKYNIQIQWQLACTNRRWCDFVSYDPRLPESLRLWQRRVIRDDDCISMLSGELIKFLDELDSKEAALRAIGGDALMMGNVIAFREPRSRRGVCADCRFICGPMADSCDNPQVHRVRGKPTVKALAARKFLDLCGPSAQFWEAKS